MTPSTLFTTLFLLPALAVDNELDDMLELESLRQRLGKMQLQEVFDEIPREGARAVITLGIFPLLNRAEHTERFLERNKDFASGFGSFARMVVFLADLYLGHAELGPNARKALEGGVDRLVSWVSRMSQRRLISIDDADDKQPTYVEAGVDPATEDLRSFVHRTFHKSDDMSSDAISGGELLALVTAPTRLLIALYFLPEEVEPSVVENLIRSQRYIAAVFRLSFRRPQKMYFEDSERELVLEYIHQVRKNLGLDPIQEQEVPAKASVSTSESMLKNEYVYFTIAIALVIAATCRYAGTIVVVFVRQIVEKLKETRTRTYDSIDAFRRFMDGPRLADALHEKEVECDQLCDANTVLNETLAAMREQLRAMEEEIVRCESFKEQASVREAELKSEIDSLRSVAEQCVEHERLQEEHYAQAREIWRRKEAAVKERLDEQCLISASLNEAVEEMQSLITAMVEANEAMATARLQAGVQGTAPERGVSTEARQATSRPDVPADPITSAVPSSTTERDDDAIQRFVTTVYITLYSLPHGYDSIALLLRDLSEDSGLDGETVAIELGYASFEAFLHSPEMAPRILLGASPDGRPRYRVYPSKADLDRYVTQQLGTDYGDTKRALARQRGENERLRRQLASTMERVEKLKSEALAKHRPTPVLDSSRFRATSTKTHAPADNTRGAFPGTDPGSRFRPADSKKNVDGPSTSRAAHVAPAPPSGSGQALQEEPTPSRDVRRHIDDLERMVHCAICMDRPKDTAFACGHTYCNECAVELRQCTFGCKKQNGKPLTFRYRLFL